MFHEVSRNSHSIAAIFGEDTDDFNKPKIIGFDQSFLKDIQSIPIMNIVSLLAEYRYYAKS